MLATSSSRTCAVIDPGTTDEGQPDPVLLERIGRWLLSLGYRFTTPTPSTHARINARAGARPARSLDEAFGWSRGFGSDLLPPPIMDLMANGGLLDRIGGLWRSTVRFSTLDDAIYAHSAYPTVAADSVFFGPDSYRFAAFIARAIPEADCLVDVGGGCGVGGIHLSRIARRVIIGDINPQALRFAKANALLAGCRNVTCTVSDVLAGIAAAPDAIISNPPYLVDRQARLYRHGGGALGIDLAVRIVREALGRLSSGGRLALYTGTPIVRGHDPFLAAVGPLLAARNVHHVYQEIDPDVFGEELDAPAYAEADRIAVVTLVAEMA